MKMDKVVKKFVLNRNDHCYYYVEKCSDGQKYYLYSKGNNVLTFNNHNFHAIYGNDVRYSLEDFINGALLKLISKYSCDDEYRKSHDNFVKVLNKIMVSRDKGNPDLGSLLSLFLEALDIYNDLNLYSEVIEPPYDENYQTIIESKSGSKETWVEHIESITRLNEEYSICQHQEAYVRTKKYE